MTQGQDALTNASSGAIIQIGLRPLAEACLNVMGARDDLPGSHHARHDTWHKWLGACPLDIGQHHSPNTALLLHRTVDAGLETRTEDSHAYGDGNVNCDRGSLAQPHLGHTRTDRNPPPNPNAMVPANADTHH